ncbi:cytochrome P450 2E1 [Trichonephila clavipes]|nr:cytochrome P450 2E1 [Trichonephila clavipes]
MCEDFWYKVSRCAQYIQDTFQLQAIRRNGSIKWSVRSPDLNLFDLIHAIPSSIPCSGAIYPSQEQTKLVRSARRSDQSRETHLTQQPKPSGTLNVTKTSSLLDAAATTLTLAITNISFIDLSTYSLQLALNEANNFPLASKAALNDFFVDDLMSGANSLSEALELQNQLTQMLSSARLVLRKWTSNCNELLNSIDSDMRLSNICLNIDNDDTVKILGRLTKITLLSTIAKTFDPLGWLSPITIQYKTIMQRLWKQQLQCDERVPPDITLEWEQLAKDVQLVKDIKIPRFLFVDSDNQFHLFGFSDASEKAYAAVICCHSVSDTGKSNVQLIIAKTRVAPLKPVSFSLLELCGALLLVTLMDFSCKSLNYPISQTQIYMDSTVVLAWVGSHASRWKTFIANRVTKVQALSSATQWHHISGSANPADLATRGVSFSTLLTSIWLCGPKFLHETFPFQTESSIPSLNDAVPEEKYCALQSTIVPNHLPDVNDLLQKFSSLSKLKRVIAYCLRFINTCINSNDKIIGLLKTSELTNAMYMYIN